MVRKLNVIIGKSGGKSPSRTYKITIPTKWIDILQITADDRTVVARCENGKIIIEKEKD